jgi:predicted nuclease with TOPRIM domain
VDSQALAVLIPIVAMLIPTAAIVMHGLQKIAAMRLEEARVRMHGGREGTEELEALRGEVSELRHELAEVHERLDFTERMLARQQEAPRLPER